MDVAKVRDKVASRRKRAGKARKCDGSKIKNEERERRRGQMSRQRERERERGRRERTTGEYTGDETRPDEMR